MWAYSKEGAINKVNRQHKKCYGSHIPCKVVEISKDDFGGDKVKNIIRNSLREENISLEKVNLTKYRDMNNAEIREITYEQCPLKCTRCEALCNEMSVAQCRKNLSQAFDKEC